MVTLEEVNGEFNLTVDYNSCRLFCSACDRIEDAVVCLESYIFPTPLEWFLICLHLGLFTIGVVGNILVCFVVLRSKHMQTVTNLFIVNLAFADAVVLVVCSPPSVLQSVTETWFMGDIMCKMVIFLQTTVVSVSVLTLCAIAVERYFAICRPLKSRITLRKVTVTVLIIWVISAAMASPNLNNYVLELFRTPELSSFLKRCHLGMDNQMEAVYTLFLVTLLYIVPMVIIGIFYLIISHHLWNVRVPGSVVRNTTYESGYRTHAEVQLASRKKVAKMLIAIVLLFAACYFPINCLFIIRQTAIMDQYTESPIIPIVFMFAHWLCYFNSAMNPLIYNFMSVKFKKEFRNVFSCHKRQNTPLHQESTWFHSTRMVRQPTNNSNHSSCRMLRVHEVTYPALCELSSHHSTDGEIKLNGGQSV